MDEGFLKAAKVYFGIVEEACNLLMDEIGKRKQAVIRNKYDLYEYLYLEFLFLYGYFELLFLY